MNRYEDLWYKTEGGNVKNLKLKYSLKFYKYTLSKGGIKITKMLYSNMGYDVPHKMLGNFYLFPNEVKEWINNNMLNKFNKEKIINLFIQNINNTFTEQNIKSRDLYINSLKELNLVDDIEIDKNNVITFTIDGNKFKFLKLLNTKEEIKVFKRNCHQICYDFFIVNKDDNNSCVVTILEKDLFDREQYHSFIVKDNIIYDYARNILMNFEKYKILFKPEIVTSCNGRELLEKIDILDNEDKEFNELYKWCPVLKYALYTINNKNSKSI